jgi:hypothetical protein
MTGFIDAVTSPWPLLAALVVFGFAPGDRAARDRAGVSTG